MNVLFPLLGNGIMAFRGTFCVRPLDCWPIIIKFFRHSRDCCVRINLSKQISAEKLRPIGRHQTVSLVPCMFTLLYALKKAGQIDHLLLHFSSQFVQSFMQLKPIVYAA